MVFVGPLSGSMLAWRIVVFRDKKFPLIAQPLTLFGITPRARASD